MHADKNLLDNDAKLTEVTLSLLYKFVFPSYDSFTFALCGTACYRITLCFLCLPVNRSFTTAPVVLSKLKILKWAPNDHHILCFVFYQSMAPTKYLLVNAIHLCVNSSLHLRNFCGARNYCWPTARYQSPQRLRGSLGFPKSRWFSNKGSLALGWAFAQFSKVSGMKNKHNRDGQRGSCSIQRVLPGTRSTSCSYLRCDPLPGGHNQLQRWRCTNMNLKKESQGPCACQDCHLLSVQSHMTAAARLRPTSNER